MLTVAFPGGARLIATAATLISVINQFCYPRIIMLLPITCYYTAFSGVIISNNRSVYMHRKLKIATMSFANYVVVADDSISPPVDVIPFSILYLGST